MLLVAANVLLVEEHLLRDSQESSSHSQDIAGQSKVDMEWHDGLLERGTHLRIEEWHETTDPLANEQQHCRDADPWVERVEIRYGRIGQYVGLIDGRASDQYEHEDNAEQAGVR